MKLAFALFSFFPRGGLTRDMLAIADACRRRGHRVRIFTGRCDGERPEPGKLDLRLLPVNAPTNYGKDRVFVRRLRRAVTEYAPDLLVGFNKMPGLDVYYAADACFADNRNWRWWQRLTPRYRHHMAFEHAVFGAATMPGAEILFIAETQMRVYHNRYATALSRMHLLPPGIAGDRIAGDDAPARRKKFRAKWQINDDEKLLLAVGAGFQSKGLDRSLSAFASLPPRQLNQAWLFVIGDGNTAAFARQARRAGIASRVRFVGGRDDVPAFLLAADLLVHPARREAGGIVLLEALVAGLPMVATDVCGYARYVSEASMGEVLAAPFHQPALNQAVRRLLEAPRDHWQNRGREFAKTADIYAMPEHACRHIEEIFARRGN